MIFGILPSLYVVQLWCKGAGNLRRWVKWVVHSYPELLISYNLSVWIRENLQKRSPLQNTLFQFDEKINNTCQNTLQNTFILSLWQKLRAQANYFHFRPSNRLFDQLDIM